MVLQITPWERDALQLLAAGVADDDIAAMLAISEGTVNSYLEDLFEKLGVTSRSEAVMAATRRGLVRVIECAEHRECLPLLTAEGETGRDAINRDRDVAGVSRRGRSTRGARSNDHGGIAVAMVLQKRQKLCLRRPSN